MSICRPQKGGEHLDQFELHWTNTLTEHFAELPPVVRQTDRQTVSYLLPAASSRRSCTRCRCCRRRRARSSRCRWAPAPWTCRWRRRRPWTHRRGWRWTRWSCPDRSSPGTARFRCSSGTDRSSPPAECPRRPRSSTAGWSTPRWRWRRGWWRWPTGRRWRGSCARSWSGRSWQPRRRGAWWWWCWGPRGPSSTGVQRGGVCSVLRISEPVLSKLTSAASDPVETLNHSRTTYLILFFISIYTDCARLYSLTASLRSRIHGKVGLCFSSCVSFSFITLLQKTKWALRREETEEEEKKKPHTQTSGIHPLFCSDTRRFIPHLSSRVASTAGDRLLFRQNRSGSVVHCVRSRWNALVCARRHTNNRSWGPIETELEDSLGYHRASPHPLIPGWRIIPVTRGKS